MRNYVFAMGDSYQVFAEMQAPEMKDLSICSQAFKGVDNYLKGKPKILVASPETKSNPDKFVFRGKFFIDGP